jgi:hypothetical protein
MGREENPLLPPLDDCVPGGRRVGILMGGGEDCSAPGEIEGEEEGGEMVYIYINIYIFP